ncbi:hypothetical protein LR48_Vigan454s000400 [Vigna angularis]|uniref:Uncharacterized protein n=1 Tax=Phaseolus angularis TaxID=3914 RepID=A0A0L9TAR8_PHAAN|nr:hypothetical protein LR48_Vigan454s000400 [Vigna angularis]
MLESRATNLTDQGRSSKFFFHHQTEIYRFPRNTLYRKESAERLESFELLSRGRADGRASKEMTNVRVASSFEASSRDERSGKKENYSRALIGPNSRLTDGTLEKGKTNMNRLIGSK